MNGQENTPTSTMLCANGCGFYGSPTTKNLCSKCYREVLRSENNQQDQQMKQQQAEAVIRAATAAVAAQPHAEPSVEPRDVEMATTTQSDEPSSTVEQQQQVSLFNDHMMNTINPHQVTPLVEQLHQQQQQSSSMPSIVISSTSSEPIPPPVSSSSSPPPEIHITETLDNSMNSTTTITTTNHPTIDATQVHLATSLLSTNSISAPGSEATSSAEDEEAPSRPVQKNKGRCFECNKKVGLLGFQCRCGYNFCGSHRHADQHNCQFDYRELARQQLSKANQKVVADKLNRI